MAKSSWVLPQESWFSASCPRNLSTGRARLVCSASTSALVLRMHSQPVIQLAGRQWPDAKLCPILAALVDLVGRQILGLHLVVSCFHRGHVFEVRHRVLVSG